MDGPFERVDCAVIGAGVVGLAAARALALAGRDVVVLEAEGAIGTGISSRNSEVIHAGMYYPTDSLKAVLCVAGNRLLRAYCQSRGVAFRMTGKLVVATGADEEAELAAILDKGRANGVEGLALLSGAEARAMEPELACSAALHSPATGIVDSHALMLSLLGEAEEKGTMVAYRSPVVRGHAAIGEEGVWLDVGGAEPMRLFCRSLVIAAGLHSRRVARSLGMKAVPPAHLCKGNYFTLSGRSPFTRLVYPVPARAGLGIHYTLDLAGSGRFGPDVEWVEAEDYRVDPARAPAFEAAIRRYWPGLPEGALSPGYAGIRPKLHAADEPACDFVIQADDEHGVPGVVALYGIESPGLTAALAIGETVRELLS